MAVAIFMSHDIYTANYQMQFFRKKYVKFECRQTQYNTIFFLSKIYNVKDGVVLRKKIPNMTGFAMHQISVDKLWYLKFFHKWCYKSLCCHCRVTQEWWSKSYCSHSDIHSNTSHTVCGAIAFYISVWVGTYIFFN